jgi:hypothetical protein
MVGGYAMIDCEGLVLTKSTNQTIDGIWEQVDAAYKSGKPCWAYNCGYNTGKLSPVSVMLLDESATEYIATSSILQVSIKNNDVCKVTSLIG